LIPAGTGMKRYRNIKVDYGVNTELMENYKLNNDYEDEFEGGAEQGSLAESDFEVRVSDDGIEIIRDNNESKI
jgi:DNA-directed RNA polymerase subunit beta'